MRRYSQPPTVFHEPGQQRQQSLVMQRPAENATATPAATGCISEIAGLKWWDSDAADYALDVQAGTVDYIDFPLDFPDVGDDLTEYQVAKAPFLWWAKILGTICPDCQIAWNVEWLNEAENAIGSPGWFAEDGPLLVVFAQQGVTQGATTYPTLPAECRSGTLTVSATVTCSNGTFPVGPITLTLIDDLYD